MTSKPYIDIVFDGPPDHESGRFVEVENEEGQSISVGEWIAPDEHAVYKMWRLRIGTERGISSIAERIHNITTSKGFSQPTMQNLPEKLMLSMSELSECMEEHRKGRGLVWFQHDSGCDSLFPKYQNVDGEPAPCSCVRKPEGILVELADSVIRNLHMMHGLIQEAWDEEVSNPEADGIRHTVGSVIKMKVDYNEGRPHMHGGNSY